MNIREELDNRAKHVEEVLTSYLPLKIGAQMIIFDAMNYSLMAGGKRIRPILMEEAYKMFAQKNEYSLVVSGVFGVIISGLFMAFGGLGNFLCEMLFWVFVLYVGAVYFGVMPDVVRKMMKKYVFLSQCLMSLAWVPMVVGGMIVIFLGSLLFVDYSAVELSEILVCSKMILFGMVVLSLGVVSVKRFNCLQFVTSF